MTADEPADAGVIEIGEQAAILPERVEDSLLDFMVGLDRAVAVEVGGGEVRDDDRVAQHPGQRVAGEHHARHLDDSMRAAGHGQPPEPGGELGGAIEGRRHRRGRIAVETAEIGEDADAHPPFGKDRRGQPRCRRLPARAGDGDHLHPSGRVAGQCVRQTSLRPGGVRYEAQRCAEGGNDPFGDNPRHAPRDRFGGLFMAIPAILEPSDEQVSRPAGLGGVMAAAGDDVVAGHEPSPRKDLREPHPDASGGRLRGSPGFPPPITTHAIDHHGLLPALCRVSAGVFTGVVPDHGASSIVRGAVPGSTPRSDGFLAALHRPPRLLIPPLLPRQWPIG